MLKAELAMHKPILLARVKGKRLKAKKATTSPGCTGSMLIPCASEEHLIL